MLNDLKMWRNEHDFSIFIDYFLWTPILMHKNLIGVFQKKNQCNVTCGLMELNMRSSTEDRSKETFKKV